MIVSNEIVTWLFFLQKEPFVKEFLDRKGVSFKQYLQQMKHEDTPGDMLSAFLMRQMLQVIISVDISCTRLVAD